MAGSMFLNDVAPGQIRPVGMTYDDEAERLLRVVRSSFPDIGGSCLRVRRGGDHVVLMAGEHAFRFPLPGQHDLRLEIATLCALRPKVALAVPDYVFVDPLGRFAGYRTIGGAPLTPARFAQMPQAAQAKMLDDIVSVLRVLHGLDPDEVIRATQWRCIWSPEQFADRLEHERLASLAARAPSLFDPALAFVRRYRSLCQARPVPVHGDLVWEHLLIDPRRDRMTGMIDFGDVALGDPASDLMGLWAYGALAATHAVERYDAARTDPGLLHRSFAHYARYRLDRFCEALADGERPDPSAGAITEVTDLLIAATASTGGPRPPAGSDGEVAPRRSRTWSGATRPTELLGPSPRVEGTA